jgi:cobalt/nickel transport system ATP-binding protein
MKDNIFEIQQITYHYPDGTKALDNVSLSISKGSKIAVLGSNGAGKSTLLLHLNGTLKPMSGQIIYKDTVLKYTKKDLNSIRKEVGMVFQDPDSQLFSASVYQDISFGPMNLKLDSASVKARIEEAMEQTEVTSFSKKPTHALSYGQKKSVSIAGILAMKPEVIVFDEPTASLDPKHTKSLLDLLDQLSAQGKTLILSTHNVESAWSFADYLYIMKEGKIYAQGTPFQVFSNETVLKETHLEKPIILELMERLVLSGVLSDTTLEAKRIPRSKEQLFSLIDQLKGVAYGT